MIQKLKLLILSLSSFIFLAAPFAFSATVSADTAVDIGKSVCSGTNGDLSSAGTQTGCTDTNVSTFDKYVKFALNLLSIIVGIAAVIMIIFGGFRYITSGGKQESVTGAKNTILYAVIGLVIVALAQVIVHFVLTESTSASTGS